MADNYNLFAPYFLPAPGMTAQSTQVGQPAARPPASQLPARRGLTGFFQDLRDQTDELMRLFRGEPQPFLRIQALKKYPRIANALERGLTTAGMIGEGSPTVGGNIALVANALLGAPQVMRQRRL